MNDQFKGFMQDLVMLLHAKYNNTLHTDRNETEKKKATRIGMNTAYYDALDLIESQLNLFNYDVKQIGNITPELGNEVKIK